MSHRPLAAAGAALLFLCAFSQAAELPRPMAERARAAAIPDEAIAFVVRRVADGQDVRAFHADVPMPPASTLKVLTSVVALETLGPAWRGSTEVAIDGPVERGVLRGNLVLRGLANVDFDAHALRQALRRLRLRGVREIRGDLVLDRTYFSPSRMDVGVPAFDESPEFRYNVIPDALLLNSNLVELELAADAKGVRVDWSPRIDGLAITSRMTLVEAPCGTWEDLWRYPRIDVRGQATDVTLQGTFPSGCHESTAIDVMDRTRYAEGLVRTAWRELGGKWRGHAREAEAPTSGEVFSTHRSRPLNEIVVDIDKRSDNPIARTIFLALGAASKEGAGESTALRAERMVRRWLAAHGLDDAGLVLENGSGLSRRERIKPDLLASVLQAGLASPWAPELEASLPIVGVDGGMRRRLADGPAASRARIKTGTLRDVSAIAGYVRGPANDRYIVVASIHHDNAARGAARPVLDALIDWVARGMPPD